jgi:hypothetical protein
MEVLNKTKTKKSLVLTTINKPNWILEKIAQGADENDIEFIVIGDKKSPAKFDLNHAKYLSLANQIRLPLNFAKNCPVSHYARKNIGYLLAIKKGANVIIETDDDNIPEENFWLESDVNQTVLVNSNNGWVNMYRYFSRENIWPRGYPLEEIQKSVDSITDLEEKTVYCPIQQGLADNNPDVDAVYRLVLPLPIYFAKNKKIALGPNSWCPFNSQNTKWFPDAFPLLYLPSYCSFRMTDIWRSYVAQIISSVNDWSILFTSPSVYQERNEHDLMHDFRDEITGYVNNYSIIDQLSKLKLKPGDKYIKHNMFTIYKSMIEANHIGKEELDLLSNWWTDLDNIRGKYD